MRLFGLDHLDHLGRWWSCATYLYPASGVARTVLTVGRWHVEVERPLAPGEATARAIIDGVRNR